MNVPKSDVCLVGRRVRIPKKFIDSSKINQDLVLVDSRGSEFSSREPFVCFKELVSNYIVPKMYGVQYINEHNLTSRDIQCDGDDVDISFNGSMREIQVPEVDKAVHSLTTVQGGVMVLYCGFGKTTCSLNISCHFKKKTLILVHTMALLEQWVERIEQFVENASVGIIRSSKCDTDGRTHVVALMQSLCRRDYEKEKMDSFGLMIVDEAHHICAAELSKCIAKIGCKLRLGLSATPDRKDGMTDFLYHSIGPVCSRVERDISDVNVEIVHVNNGPFEVKYISRMGKQSPNISRMINDLCNEDCRLARYRMDLIIGVLHEMVKVGRHIIVLSDRRSHLSWMKRILDDLKLDSSLMVGGLKKKEIEDASKSRVILATYAYCSEGLDIPTLDTCVFTTPRSDVVQCCGRILRIHKDKQIPLVVDFVDQAYVFVNQSRKREKYYVKLTKDILHVDENLEPIMTLSTSTKKAKVEDDFEFKNLEF